MTVKDIRLIMGKLTAIRKAAEAEENLSVSTGMYRALGVFYSLLGEIFDEEMEGAENGKDD